MQREYGFKTLYWKKCLKIFHDYLTVFIIFQPCPEQRGRQISDGKRSLQLLQSRLSSPLHPASHNQQLSSLQLWPSHWRSEHLGQRLPWGSCLLLWRHDEQYRCFRAAVYYLRGGLMEKMESSVLTIADPWSYIYVVVPWRQHCEIMMLTAGL